MKIKKRNLLLMAFAVWFAAGFNVALIGLKLYRPYITVLNIILSCAVFGIFQYFIFGRMVKKHTVRIKTYKEEKQFILKFFDVPSFMIMAFMMSGGILIRKAELMPEIFIAIFYSGLGLSLALAGILFLINFIKWEEQLCRQ